MAPMLGERFLPDSVNSRRRMVRSRIRDLREPLRSRRQNLVPGPDIIGRAENTVMDLRDRFVSRDSVLGKMKSKMGSGSSGSSGGSKSGSGSGMT